MNLNELRRLAGLPLLEAPVPVVSPQQALDAGWFGPVYHGTPSNIDDILSAGFDVARSVPVMKTAFGRPVGTSNGYRLESYGFTGVAAPVHHLGFGIYFTTAKSIAKAYNGGSVKGLRTFYLDVPLDRVEEINFGSPNTMMKWWRANGYDMTPEATAKGDFNAWIKATANLTRTLNEKFDAVHFLGKGFAGRLLDGDQVVVFDPKRVRVVDPKLATGIEIGAKVVHTQSDINLRSRMRNDLYIGDVAGTRYARDLGPGWRGVFWAIDHEGREVKHADNFPRHLIPPPGLVGVVVARRDGPDGPIYDVKWAKGGVKHNYRPEELAPAPQKRARGN